MARAVQISKEKRQSIITLRHEGESIRNISRTLNLFQVESQQPSSAMMKLALMRTGTGKEDCHQGKGWLLCRNSTMKERFTVYSEQLMLRCVCYLNFEAFIWAAIWGAVNSNELILCSRGNSGSSFPMVVLMRASFIIALDGFCDCTWRNFSGLTDLHVLK